MFHIIIVNFIIVYSSKIEILLYNDLYIQKLTNNKQVSSFNYFTCKVINNYYCSIKQEFNYMIDCATNVNDLPKILVES